MRALVCAVHGIGNCIRTLPLIGALHALGHEVDVRMSRSRGAALIFEACPDVRKVFDTSVKLTGYDVACCTQICSHFHSGCSISQRKLIVEPGRRQATGADPLGGYQKHEIAYNMDLARELGYTGAPIFALPTASVDFEHENAVALGPGYLKMDDHSHRKHWGNVSFARLAELLIAAGFFPVLLGGKSDAPDAIAIAGAVDGELANLCEALTLLQTFGVLARCRAIVCNETMLVPAASALDVPCLSLVLREAKHVNLVKNSPYRNGVAIHDNRAAITPVRVLARLQSLLSAPCPVGGVNHD